MPQSDTLFFRPSSHYWRARIHRADDLESLRVIALALVHDLERHKAALRDLGYMPPKTYWAPGELADKHGIDPSPGLPSPCEFRATK